jgi:hypothetical protein
MTRSASPVSSTASPVLHEAFFNAGGLGILVGDGQLPNPGLEKILETYYSYALSDSTQLSADYQFLDNPALEFADSAFLPCGPSLSRLRENGDWASLL